MRSASVARMTGGWPRKAESRQGVYVYPSTDLERPVDEALEQWMRVWSARRAANRALRALGTSFPQWRVLYATAQLVRRAPQGVSELSVAQCTDMDFTTVSRVLLRLERKGFVDRGQSECAFTYEVLLTGAGQALVDDGLQEIRRFADAIVQASRERAAGDADD